MRNFCCCFPKKKKKPIIGGLRLAPSRSGDLYPGGPRIIIIGAGAAGLACAVELIDSGIHNVRILEAENRIGGRIHTIPFGDNVVNLGSQFVHGEMNNVVHEMVEKMNILSSETEYYVSFQCIRSNGDIVDDGTVQNLKAAIAGLFENIRQKMEDYDGTFLDFLEDEFMATMDRPENKHLDRAIVREFFKNFIKMESSEVAFRLSEISAKGFLAHWECEGDYMLSFREQGFREFIRILTRATSYDNLGVLSTKVILNAEVKQILWDQMDGKVSVICENYPQPFVADNVVVTVSLGVLKERAKNMFIPELPESKLEAIEGIGYGQIFKVYMEFPYAFWPASWNGFTTLWRNEDLHELRMNGLLWMQEIYGFYRISYQSFVLEALAVGPEVKRFEGLSKKELQMRLMDILRRFLKDWDIPEPNSIVASSWSSNNHFRGAFSFRTLITESRATSANELAKPLNIMLDVFDEDDSVEDIENTLRSTIKPTVLFAGEATSPRYFSTVHGAVETGWREAKRLLGYYDIEI